MTGQRKISDGAAAVFSYVVVSALFWGRFLFTKQALFYDTYFKNFFPDAVFFRKCVLAGEWPFWNPHMYSGIPFLANTEPSVFYPLTLLQIPFSYPTAVYITTWAHAVLAASFMYLLIKSSKLSHLGALFGGLIYGFNGYFVNHYAYTHIYQGYAWLPFTVWAFKKSLSGKETATFVLAGLGVALQIFSGHPQFVFYTGLVLLITAAASARAGAGPSGHWRPFILLSAIFLLALALAAVQLVPTLQFAFDSPRKLGSGYAWATMYSLKPLELGVMLLVPAWNRLFVPTSGDPNVVGFYVGWPILILAISAVIQGKKKQRQDWRPLATMAVLGFALALGKFLPGYRLMYELLPPFRIFRFPAQALYLSCFGISILAALGLDGLTGSPRRKALLLVLCGLDLWSFSWKAVKTIDPAFYQTETPTVRWLKSKGIEGRFMLTPKTRAISWRTGRTEFEAAIKYIDTLYPNLGMAYGLYDAEGLQELRLQRYDDILNDIGNNPLSPWMNVLGIRYLFSFWKNVPDRFSVLQTQPFFIYENPRAFPKAYVVGESLLMPEKETLAFVTAHPQHDFRKTVIINRPVPPTAERTNEPMRGEARVTAYGPNNIRINVGSVRPAWLVVTDNDDPGWSAKVNGKPAVVYLANYVQRAVQVPDGYSVVEFQYRPPWFNAGLALSLLSAAIAAFYFWRFTR